MTDTRKEFEAAYAKAYPVTCQITPDVFEQDYDGYYTRTPVQVGWIMWQAGAQHERAEINELMKQFGPLGEHFRSIIGDRGTP